MMKPKLWQIEQLAALPTEVVGAASGPWLNLRSLSRAVFGERARSSGLCALAYLWRRFGPPLMGCDRHKRLASYVLTTPKPDVWLSVDVGAGELGSCFGYVVPAAVEERAMQQRRRRSAGYAEALAAALGELQRPVYVDDVAITIFGLATEADLRCEPAQPSGYAGLGVPKAAMDRQLQRR